jgi:hypothetical protein
VFAAAAAAGNAAGVAPTGFAPPFPHLRFFEAGAPEEAATAAGLAVPFSFPFIAAPEIAGAVTAAGLAAPFSFPFSAALASTAGLAVPFSFVTALGFAGPHTFTNGLAVPCSFPFIAASHSLPPAPWRLLLSLLVFSALKQRLRGTDSHLGAGTRLYLTSGFAAQQLLQE